MPCIQTRKTQSGKVSYRAVVRMKGFPSQSATFKRKTDATRWGHQVEAAMKEGRYFQVAEAKKHTLAELISQYIDQVLPTKPKSRHGQSMQLRWWKKEIGAYLLVDVTPALLAQCRDKLLQETTRRGRLRSPATVVRYMAALSHALNIAVKEWGWLENNPLAMVRRPKEPRGRVRYLTDSERERFLEACKNSECVGFYSIVVLALSTGMRRGEILGLTWDDVDLKRGRVILQQTKNGQRRAVPVQGYALSLLRDHGRVRRLDTSRVFPAARSTQPVDLRRPWDKAVKTAELADFRFHDLRHCAASYLAMNGATTAEIAEVLGHKTLQMVQRYAHLSETHTKGVVASMNEEIFRRAK